MTRCYRNSCSRALRRPAVKSSGARYPARPATAALPRASSWGFVRSSVTAMPIPIPVRSAPQVRITTSTTAKAPPPIRAKGADEMRSIGGM